MAKRTNPKKSPKKATKTPKKSAENLDADSSSEPDQELERESTSQSGSETGRGSASSSMPTPNQPPSLRRSKRTGVQTDRAKKEAASNSLAAKRTTPTQQSARKPHRPQTNKQSNPQKPKSPCNVKVGSQGIWPSTTIPAKPARTKQSIAHEEDEFDEFETHESAHDLGHEQTPSGSHSDKITIWENSWIDDDDVADFGLQFQRQTGGYIA